MEVKQLWVYTNWTEEHPDKPSEALLAKAQCMASENAMELSAVLAGEGCLPAARWLAEKGVKNIYTADITGLNPCEYMRITEILCPLITEKKPDIFLFPTTDTASLVASSLGQRLHTGVTVHCVSAQIRDGILIGSVPSFGGQMMGEIYCPRKRPQIATLRAEAGQLQNGTSGTVIAFADEIPKSNGLTLLSAEAEPKFGISLSEAELIVCGEAGIQDAKGWELVKELAQKLGAAACCTRDAVDMDCGASEKEMVGVSGLSVSPKVYLGFGVSGSAYHVCGMKDSGLVLNVNHDADNPFFKSSDYGYVGDAKEILTELLNQL